MTKIYFDSKPLNQGHAVRGIGYYTKNLLEQFQGDKRVELVDNAEDSEVVFSPYFDLFFNTLKPVFGKKNIVTVFDVIPLLYPKHYPAGFKGKINLLRQKRALSHADAVITISETSKKDIVRFLGIKPNKVFPIHLAPQSDFKKMANGKWQMEITKRYGLPDRFVLYVGDVNFNKNLLTLAEACQKLKTPLVVVGRQAADENADLAHPENKSFAEFLKRFKNSDQVLRLGYVETEDLVEIYNLATVYCQPSLYEGFGLPVLEAQACGTPVVATRIQAHVEMAENSCLFVENPTNSSEMAEKISQVFKDKTLREKLVKAGLENVKLFSWRNTLEKTLEVF